MTNLNEQDCQRRPRARKLVLHLCCGCDLNGCSDYACFRREEVPAIWLFTGFHSEYGTPQDDVELINGPGIVEIGDLALATLVDLMVRSERLPFGTVLPQSLPATVRTRICQVDSHELVPGDAAKRDYLICRFVTR